MENPVLARSMLEWKLWIKALYQYRSDPSLESSEHAPPLFLGRNAWSADSLPLFTADNIPEPVSSEEVIDDSFILGNDRVAHTASWNPFMWIWEDVMTFRPSRPKDHGCPNPVRCACKYLVAVGAVYVDTILTVPHYPAEDEKLRATQIVRRRGGNCPNMLEVVAQLTIVSNEGRNKTSGFAEWKEGGGTELALVAVLPNKRSPIRKDILKSMTGVDLDSAIFRHEIYEAANSFIIKSMQSGTRTIVNYNQLPEMTFEEFKECFQSLSRKYVHDYGYDHQSGWYHFEGRIPDVTLKCIEFLRKTYPRIKISAEVEKPRRTGLQELATKADVVFYSMSWAKSQGYSSAEECLRAQAVILPTASYLFCTWGEEGAAALDVPNDECLVLPSFKPFGTVAIDTIGAGDTFIAGILYSFLKFDHEWDLARKLSFAIELAGRKVVREGFDQLGRDMQHWIFSNC